MRLLRPLRFALLLAALVPVFASSASAKDAKDEGTTREAGGAHLRWSRTYAGAMAEAKARGCVIFATFHEDG
jgi:hypothetical protein